MAVTLVRVRDERSRTARRPCPCRRSRSSKSGGFAPLSFPPCSKKPSRLAGDHLWQPLDHRPRSASRNWRQPFEAENWEKCASETACAEPSLPETRPWRSGAALARRCSLSRCCRWLARSNSARYSGSVYPQSRTSEEFINDPVIEFHNCLRCMFRGVAARP